MNRLAIRVLEQADIPAIDTVLIQAFGQPDSRVVELERYLKIQPDGWFIGLLEDEPVGLVGAVDYGPFAYIGLMGVHPAHQGHGIGRALMTHLLAWLEGRGVTAALLDATDKGYPLYASLGFVAHDLARVFVQDQPLRLVPPPPAAIQTLQHTHLDELVAFDLRAFGADRRRVFQLLLDEGQLAFAVRQAQAGSAGDITGYVFVQGKRLGPWVAQDAASAEVLLQAVLSAPDILRGGPVMTVIPGTNSSADALLARYGFRSPRHIRHMCRGQIPSQEHREWVYGQTSFAIG